MENHSFTIELGVTVKSKISKFTGIVTSRSEHINGCDRYWVEPTVDREGKKREGFWFDDKELEVVTSVKKIKGENNHSKIRTGGFPSSIK